MIKSAPARGSRWLLAVYAACVLVVPTATTPTTSVRTALGSHLTAPELTGLFQAYGDASGEWGGADRTASVSLPDGRVLWLFSDTFLGAANPDGSRPRSASFIHNSAVIQQGRELTATVHGGTTRRPESLVPAGRDGQFYWIGDATVSGDSVQVLLGLYHRSGKGPLDHALLGTALATLALPDLTLRGVRPLALGERVSWGSEILTDGGYTYVYGTEAAGVMKFAHVARVRGTDLTGRWQFWTGSGWSTFVGDSARLLSGVGTTYGVQRVGSRFVLVTHENNLVFSPDVVAYTAASPTGPFTGPQYLFQAPEVAAGNIVYDADVHPGLARPGRLLVSYNVNNLDEATTYADARIYRPRFVEVAWPPPPVDRKRLPPAPTELTATVRNRDHVSLRWSAPPGEQLRFRVYRRDHTAGQTHLVRLPGTVADPAYEALSLQEGHVYDFAVAAVDDTGEGPESKVVTVKAIVPPPTPPTNVQATAGTAGEVALRWDPNPLAQRFEVFYRDMTVRQGEPTAAGAFPDPTATVGRLQHGHDYEFTVVAVGNGQKRSKPSTPVRVLVNNPPPRDLRAEAASHAVTLTWMPSGSTGWYWVYQRDVTARQKEFVRDPVAVQDTRATINGLQNGHRYEFKVAAVEQDVPGPFSEIVRADPALPAPVGVAVLDTGDGTARLTWEPVPDARAYRVQRRDATAGEPWLTDPIAAFDTSFQAILLQREHHYEFRVLVADGAGDGPPSAIVGLTVH